MKFNAFSYSKKQFNSALPNLQFGSPIEGFAIRQTLIWIANPPIGIRQCNCGIAKQQADLFHCELLE